MGSRVLSDIPVFGENDLVEDGASDAVVSVAMNGGGADGRRIVRLLISSMPIVPAIA